MTLQLVMMQCYLSFSSLYFMNFSKSFRISTFLVETLYGISVFSIAGISNFFSQSFLSYAYVLHKFCELLELDHLLPFFPLLKSREKLQQQDQICEKMCKDLKWQYIPSV